LVKTNKQEVDAFLAEDPILRAEIDYEIKQFDRAKQERQQQAEQAVTVVLSGCTNTDMAPPTLRKSLSSGIGSPAALRAKSFTPKQAVRSAVKSTQIRTAAGLVLSVHGPLVQVLSTAKKMNAKPNSAVRKLSSVSFGEEVDDGEGAAAADDDVERLLSGIHAVADFAEEPAAAANSANPASAAISASPFGRPAKCRNSSRGSLGSLGGLLMDDDDLPLSSSKGNSSKRRRYVCQCGSSLQHRVKWSLCALMIKSNCVLIFLCPHCCTCNCSWSVVVGNQLDDASSPSSGGSSNVEPQKENSMANKASADSNSGATPAKKKGRVTKKATTTAAAVPSPVKVFEDAVAAASAAAGNSLAGLPDAGQWRRWRMRGGPLAAAAAARGRWGQATRCCR
jgi:hypothetical protein